MGVERPSGVEAPLCCGDLRVGVKYVSDTGQLEVEVYSIEEVEDVAGSCSEFGETQQ